jgi:hypothetical protein
MQHKELTSFNVEYLEDVLGLPLIKNFNLAGLSKSAFENNLG